jgi:hypothetical protein
MVMGMRRPSIATAFLLTLPLIVLTGAGPNRAGAQEVSVRSYLTPPAVGVGQTFVVNLEVAGSQNLDSDPVVPDMSSFAAYLGSGTSTSMQMVNNRTTVSLTIQYRYQALEVGTFSIPPIRVAVEGSEYATEELTLTVSDAPPPTQEAPSQQDPTVIGPEDVFLTVDLSRSRIREGEPFIVEYRIFTRVNIESYGFTRLPEYEGFWVEELPLPDQPQVEQVVRDGQPYTTAVIRRVALVPTGPGERVLESLGLEAQVRVRQRRGIDPFESFFDLDRSSLFGTMVPASAASEPLTVQVEALPPGRPSPFSGVVGDLTLDATLSGDSIDANDAVTLTITASGQGNLKSVPEPALDLPADFEAYPPEVSESVTRSGAGLRGQKTWEYVLIPRAPGSRDIPSISMGYFDTGTDRFATAETPALNLLVSGTVSESPVGIVRGGVASLREDIRFIHLGRTRFSRVNSSPYSGWGFWLIVLLPMVAVLGATVLRYHRERLLSDPAYARGRRAGKVAHARLADAKRLAGAGAPREFYAEVARSIRGLVADKLDVAEAGLQMDDIDAGLRKRNVSPETLEETLGCLRHCDLQRFAPEGSGGEAETQFLDRVATLLTRLNREMGQ